jgi:hypothetical protein
MLGSCARLFAALSVVVAVTAASVVPSDARKIPSRYQAQWHERVVTAFTLSNGAYVVTRAAGPSSN